VLGLYGNAVTTELAGFAAANQLNREYSKWARSGSYKVVAGKAAIRAETSRLQPFIQPTPGVGGVITKCPNWAGFRGFVLNAPLSSSISR
jgi:hypothetical protein